MKKIALYGSYTENMLRALEEKLPEGFQLFQVAKDAPMAELGDADYIIGRSIKLPAEKIAQLPQKCRMIHRWGVGYDSVDIKAAGERGIPVAVCTGGNSQPVAEMTVALMLAVYRNLVPLIEGMKQGQQLRERYSPRSYLISGKVVGFFGMGCIAKKVAHIVKEGFDAQVIYNDVFRLPEDLEKQWGYRFVSMQELARQSDILTIHVPLTEETAGIINAQIFDQMKPTSILVNTARGGVVNQQDLIDALRAGKIMGAGLDTFAEEPLSPDSPLLSMDCVVTTPHCSGNTIDNDINMAAICMDQIAACDRTGPWDLRGIVNREFLKA